MTPIPAVPYAVPADIRDLLVTRLSEPGLSALSSHQRAFVRNLAAEVYTGGYQDGRVAEITYAALDRDLEAQQDAPAESPEKQTHVWQTIRVVGTAPGVPKAAGDDDDEVMSFPALLRLRCSCGTWATLRAEATGLVLPPCPTEGA